MAKWSALAFSLILMFPSLSWPWSETAHFTVCEIAYRQLEPSAKSEIKRLMGERDFVKECTWPDKIRQTDRWKHTYSWHFINVEDTERYPEVINPEGDAVQALILAEDTLRNDSSDDLTKAYYLKFLGHFAGDIHQPLHVGRRSDKGGNTIYVTWFGSSVFQYTEALMTKETVKKAKINLHKIWDFHLVDKFIQDNRLEEQAPEKHIAYADKIQKASKNEIERWQKATYLDWALESLEARKNAYDIGDSNLGQKYYGKNVLTANERIKMGGYRLAGVLNRIFKKVPLSKAERDMRERIKKALEKRDSALSIK